MPNSKYRSIFISDVHLGSKACEANKLCDFLKNNTCQTLYLVGDIVDFWKLNREVYWPQEHSNVIRRLLTASKRGTRVKYVIGNHDEPLRQWFGDFANVFGNIEVANHFDHWTVSGHRVLVTHGDLFDGVVQYHKWLSLLGDRAYSGLLWLNRIINQARAALGRDYWSFSSYIKVNTKQAVAFITKFEDYLQEYARSQNYQAVICGHIHSPCIKTFADMVYINTGDWCETVSAVAETFDGKLQLLVWDATQAQLVIQNEWNPNAIADNK